MNRSRWALGALLVTGAAMVAASAVIHLYLWGKEDGYRAVPTVGPLFLAQAVSGLVLAPLLVAWRRWPVAALGAAWMAASLGGLYRSVNGGLFGYDETWDAPWVRPSLIVELVGLTALLGALALLWAGRPVRARAVGVRPAPGGP